MAILLLLDLREILLVNVERNFFSNNLLVAFGAATTFCK